MRESSRAEVREIAAAIAFETVMRYGDALARSPHAEITMDTIARQAAAEVARSIADDCVARVEDVLQTARAAAGETATDTAARVAVESAAKHLTDATASILTEARAAVDEELQDAWEALEESRLEMQDAVARFVQDEAARVIAAIVARTVPPVVEVRVGETVELGRVGGQTHAVLPDVLLALGAGCHTLLVGPADTGKSMMARQAAEAFGQEFHALSLGPTTPMSKIFGYYDAHGNYHPTPFQRAFEQGGLMLLDELDSGHPGLLAELNQALSLRSCAFADGMVTAHPDFRLVATKRCGDCAPRRPRNGSR